MKTHPFSDLQQSLQQAGSPAEGEAILREYCESSVSRMQHSQQLVLTPAGVDEAGRGPVAGPVTAAAVCLPADYVIPGLNDSKKLTEKKRDELVPLIKEQALAWGIAHASPQEIDDINILQATFLAMRRAIQIMQSHFATDSPQFLIAVDGNHMISQSSESSPFLQTPVIKGDSRVACIAAASVLAKTERDHLMGKLDKEYPGYHLAQNKGYPGKDHIEAIRKHGYSACHRKSFQIKALNQLSLF